MSTESRQVVARGHGEWGVTANGFVVSFWGDENFLNLIVVIVAQ